MSRQCRWHEATSRGATFLDLAGVNCLDPTHGRRRRHHTQEAFCEAPRSKGYGDRDVDLHCGYHPVRWMMRWVRPIRRGSS